MPHRKADHDQFTLCMGHCMLSVVTYSYNLCLNFDCFIHLYTVLLEYI